VSALPDQNPIIAEINRVEEAIAKLKEEQANALKRAVYVTRSKEEATAYDARAKRIAELIERLDRLKDLL
jgi:hypothetical protein